MAAQRSLRFARLLLIAGPGLGAQASHAQAPRAAAHEFIRSDVDATVKPGDDFFAYANGAWLKSTIIPVGKARWGARDEINDITRQRIAKLLDDARNAKAGSLARKVADFREAYINEL